MITRRGFLTGLVATTALVAVPGAAYATISLEDLLKERMRQTEKRMKDELEELLYGDSSVGHPDGLASLVSDQDQAGSHCPGTLIRIETSA